MNHCPIRGISLNYVTEGKWYLPSVGRSYFIRDRTGVSLAGSAFFSVLFRGFWFFLQGGLCWFIHHLELQRQSSPTKYWAFDCMRQIIYFMCRELDWWYFIKCHWVVGPQVSCQSSVLKHLPQCQRFRFLIFFKTLSRPQKRIEAWMNLWPLCSTAGTGSLAASCGSNLPFCHVLFAPHTSLRGERKPVNHF